MVFYNREIVNSESGEFLEALFFEKLKRKPSKQESLIFGYYYYRQAYLLNIRSYLDNIVSGKDVDSFLMPDSFSKIDFSEQSELDGFSDKHQNTVKQSLLHNIKPVLVDSASVGKGKNLHITEFCLGVSDEVKSIDASDKLFVYVKEFDEISENDNIIAHSLCNHSIFDVLMQWANILDCGWRINKKFIDDEELESYFLSKNKNLYLILSNEYMPDIFAEKQDGDISSLYGDFDINFSEFTDIYVPQESDFEPVLQSLDISTKPFADIDEFIDAVKKIICRPDKIKKERLLKYKSDSAFVKKNDVNILVSQGGTSRYQLVNPAEGAGLAVLEAYRRMVASGAKPSGFWVSVSDFSADNPQYMARFISAINSIKQVCSDLEVPILAADMPTVKTGKSNDENLPLAIITAVGKSDFDVIPAGFVAEDEVIIRVGDMEGHLGCSLYKEEFGEDNYKLPEIDVELEYRTANFINLCSNNKWINSCHTIGSGGQIIAISEMAIISDIGARIDISLEKERAFGEDQARYIITTSSKNAELILKKAPEHNLTANMIGETIKEKRLEINEDKFIELAELVDFFHS